MSILTRPIEELLSYLLTRLHGGFLLQQLDHRNFHVNVAEGIYTLKDIQLNPVAINQNLSESLLHLFAASVSRVTLQIPNMFRFLEDPINITIHHLILDLCSANESGHSVIRVEKSGPCTEEDGTGINLLTKSIGSFLSKINLQANLVKIKIRVKPTDKQYLQIVIPKVSFMEKNSDNESCNKVMSIEGLRINLMNGEEDIYDPHDYSNLLVMEQAIEAEINLSKDLLFVNCVISKICAVLSLSQVQSLIEILTGLKNSGKYEQVKFSALSEALQAIGEDMQDSLNKVLSIRENVVKVHVSCVVVCMTLEEIPPFNKKWTYNEGAYPAVPTSHVVLVAKKITANYSHKIIVKVSKIQANHYNYLPSAALDASGLFASAKESFFNEFFVKKPQGGFWEPDYNKCHFCIGNILLFRRSHTDFAFPQLAHFRPVKNDLEFEYLNDNLTLNSAAVEISLNIPILVFIKSLIDSNKNPPSQLNFKFKVSVPFLRMNYKEMIDKCLCQGHEWLMIGDTSWISINNSQNLEITLSKFEVTILIDDILTTICLANNVKFIREVKKPINSELLEESKEEVKKSYYEPNQGTIGIKPGSENEPYDLKTDQKNSSKFKEISQVELELAIGKACCVNTIEINKVTIRVEPGIIKKILKFFLIGKDTEKWSLATKVKIGVVSVELLNKDKSESRHISQSTFSYYSLDASVNRTVNVMTDHWIGLIIATINDVQVLSLNNCLKTMQKFTKVNFNNIEVYAKHQELLYCIGQNPVEITVNKSESEEIFVKLENFIISLDVILAYSDFLTEFNIKIPKLTPSLDCKKIVLKNIFLDFYNKELRVLTLLDSGYIEHLSVDSNSSAVYCDFKNLRTYTQDSVKKPHPIFQNTVKDYEELLIQAGCSLILTLDAVDSYMSLITPLHPAPSSDDLNHDLPVHSCLLGSSSCQRLSGPFYISKDIRTSILHQKLLDLHINLGCIIFHLYPSTSKFLSTILTFPSSAEDPPETFLNNSGKSSDESEISSRDAAGILIKPSEPGKIANINLQDYLDPSKSMSSSVKKPQISKPVQNLTKLSVIHCHPEAPKSYLKTKNEKFLHNLNAEHGLPTLRFTGGVSLVILNIYSKPNNSRSTRKVNLSQITIKTQSLSISFSKFPQKLHYSWRMTLSISSLIVNDFVAKSIVRNILNKDSQKNASGSFLTLEVAAVWPRPEFISDTEMIVHISVIPIKLNIDQYFVDFILDIINWKPEEQVIMYQTGLLPNQAVNIEKKTHKETYLQKVVIECVSINIDYIPHSLDARHPGGNILNLFEIRDFNIILPKLDLKGVKGWQSAMDQGWSWWLEHLKDKELYRLIGNIGPFSSINNMKTAFLEVLNIGSGGASVTDSTKRALVGLVKSASVEGISFIETLVTGTYSVFMGVGAVVGVNMPSRQLIVRPLQDAQCLIDRDRIGIQYEKYRD